ncbi:MAG: LamG-like jellyroll fold domain-containing protein [Chthoniobacteraceae bacterium]
MGTAQAQRATLHGFQRPGATATPVPSGIWNGVVSYWKLDETSGNRIDATGHGYNLVPSSTTIGYTTGLLGNATTFPGKQPLSVSNSAFSSIKTTAGWFKITSQPTYYQRLINAGIQVYEGGDLVWDASHFHTIKPSLNQWHFVCAVLRGSTVTMWFNNQSWVVQTNASSISDAGFELSDSNYSVPGAIIDEVGTWSRALSDDEIAQLYNSGKGITYPSVWSGILAYWKLDEASGTRIDATGHGYNLSVTGNDMVQTTGKIGNAALSNPTLGYLSNTSFSVSPSSGATISFWGKLNETSDPYQQAVSIESTSDGACSFQVYLKHNDSMGNMRISFSGSGWTGGATLSSVAPDTSSPHLYVAVIDPSTLTLYFYKDGQLAASVPYTNWTTKTLNMVKLFSASPNQLGGWIDEVGVWNRPLSSNEVATLYNSGAGITY